MRKKEYKNFLLEDVGWLVFGVLILIMLCFLEQTTFLFLLSGYFIGVTMERLLITKKWRQLTFDAVNQLDEVVEMLKEKARKKA